MHLGENWNLIPNDEMGNTMKNSPKNFVLNFIEEIDRHSCGELCSKWKCSFLGQTIYFVTVNSILANSLEYINSFRFFGRKVIINHSKVLT